MRRSVHGVLTIPPEVADALLNRIGASPWVADQVVLGHARPKLLRTYMPTLSLNEARGALQRWGDELEAIPQSPSGSLAAQVPQCCSGIASWRPRRRPLSILTSA